MSGRFDGKVVVITAAAGGIGSAAAVRFGEEGARVVLVDLAEAPLDNVAAAVTQAGGTALSLAANVTCSDDVARYVVAAVDPRSRRTRPRSGRSSA